MGHLEALNEGQYVKLMLLKALDLHLKAKSIIYQMMGARHQRRRHVAARALGPSLQWGQRDVLPTHDGHREEYAVLA